ncbi:hypothetical protein BEWA_008030 [Theileria equi strain WA]|uniref:Uncharacterized protein n=1 Tax=Theileria equi strain WA TaxID=1537102 RepID=L0B1P6_THEEQ|nr:hypothetical protein BEWA_008030 [Theileria equi strain WA]AFZ81393.1 hypothetical protein BEWA_008030 [Theileria equi strain WA]|eukprot:XP_004831059.1 hypothetical protein BEWA_008030 [Theileria equi strain WA]
MKHSIFYKDDVIESYDNQDGRRVSLRKRTKSRRYTESEYGLDADEFDKTIPHVNEIIVENETKAWNSFYTNEKISDIPFSGFGTAETVKVIALSLRRLRKNSELMSNDDTILEVGHGKHPLIWDLRKRFRFRYYFGIEFSDTAIFEAIKLKSKLFWSDKDNYIGKNAEFLSTSSLKYFNPDGSTTATVVVPENLQKSTLCAGSISIILGKSFLDYISCRLTQSINASNWNAEPRISQSVVDTFDSLALALRDSDSSILMFIEPDDFVKFRDHIGIITKVIYTSTFIKDSPAKMLKLAFVRRHNNLGAICYSLKRTSVTYKDYLELRNDVYEVTKKLYQLQGYQDEDWLLPYTVPPKWNSTDTKDFENISYI